MALGLTTAVGIKIIAGIAGAIAAAGAGHYASKINWAELEKNWETTKETFKNYFKNKYAWPTRKVDIKTPSQEPNQEPNQEKKPEGEKGNTTFIPPIPSLKEDDNNNWEEQLGNYDLNSYLKEFEDKQKTIADEMKEYESTSVERWIASARRAGVNVNLLNSIGQADSNAYTMLGSMNESELTKLMEGTIALIEQEIDQNWSGDENSKQRFINALTQFGVALIFSGGKGISITKGK